MAKPSPGALLISAALACCVALPIAGRAEASGSTPPPATSALPSDPSDVYVQGKFDDTGTYIPPHYAPKPKPTFHGYFDKNAEFKHGYYFKPKPKIIPKPGDTDGGAN